MMMDEPMPFELVNIKKLKPCPFCGGAAKASFLTTDPDNAFDLGWIGCQNCRCFISHINIYRCKNFCKL